ncbi:ComF family protein [Listeria weihenstephanensis]|nr:ComF family protein [Listeria weihenstephanensis]MBC1500421.1 ComF family protein [Listeria weihenstephanensis]
MIVEISWSSLFLEKEKVVICQRCKSELSQITGHVCSRCGRMRHEHREEVMCGDCERWSLGNKTNHLDQNIACFEYNNFAKELMALYKYKGDYVLGAVFAAALQQKCMVKNKSIIIPLPISEERRYERGFNQTEGLLHLAGIPFETQLKREHTEKQSKKSRKERIEQEQFFFVENNTEISSREIVLVDDIYTTGATLHLAAKALKEAGAKSVSSITIFR